MKIAALMELAEQAGVTFYIGSAGKIKAKGEAEQINRLAPMIREHKAELLAYLQSVHSEMPGKTSANTSSHKGKKAYLDEQGRLRIPLDADDKYRYWAGGQSVFDTLLELGASDKEIEAHIGPIRNPTNWKRWQEIKKERHGQNNLLPPL